MKKGRKECWKASAKTVREGEKEAYVHREGESQGWIEFDKIWNRWRRHPGGLAVNRIAVVEFSCFAECASRSGTGRYSRERDNSSVSSHVLAETIPVSSTHTSGCDLLLCRGFDTERSLFREQIDAVTGVWKIHSRRHMVLWKSIKGRMFRCPHEKNRAPYFCLTLPGELVSVIKYILARCCDASSFPIENRTKCARVL